MPAANGKKRRETFTPEELKLINSILDVEPPIVELTVSDINIDWTYQTRYRERIRNQIKNRLSVGLLKVLLVSQRPDGTYWVFDGATRVLGILDRGEKNRVIRCAIYQTEGQKVEALLFAFFNGRRSQEPTKLETSLQAYSVAGTDHGFGKAVHDCGFDLVGGGKRHLSGPGYVKRAWDLDGDGEAMKKALYSLKDAWRDKYNLTGYMVLGVALLYHAMRHRSIDEQMRRVLHRKGPEDIMDLVSRRWAKAGGRGPRIHPDDKPKLIARCLADEINKNPGKPGKLDVGKLEEVHVGM